MNLVCITNYSTSIYILLFFKLNEIKVFEIDMALFLKNAMQSEFKVLYQSLRYRTSGQPLVSAQL